VPAWNSGNSNPRPLHVYSGEVGRKVGPAARQLVAFGFAIVATALLLSRLSFAPADQPGVSRVKENLPIVGYSDMIAGPAPARSDE
jgi:hypothetical protein